MSLTAMTASGLAAEYRTRGCTPVDVAEECLRRAQAISDLRAYSLLDPSTTMRWAEKSARRHDRGAALGPLDGVPFAIKDVLSLTGWPTRRGSRAASTHNANFTSPSVQNLLNAGAIPLGKTATAELGWKAVTDSELLGITRNPIDPSLTAGGSSGGSAAAVAAMTVPVALGTDGGGSVRIPASFCGVVGAIATYGRVPFWPVPPLGTLVRCGPIARSVTDATAVISVLSTPDRRVPGSARLRPLEAVHEQVDRLRIGVCEQVDGLAPTDEVRAKFSPVLDRLRATGHHLVELTDTFSGARKAFETIWEAGHARMTATQPRPEKVSDPGLLKLAAAGRSQHTTEFLHAAAEQLRITEEVCRVLEPLDLVLTPTVAVEPFAAGFDTPPDWHEPEWWSWASFSYVFNLSGHPAITLPIRQGAGMLPFGVQLVGKIGGDAALFSAAASLELLFR